MQPGGRSGSSSRNIHNNPSSAGSKASAQVEGGNLRLSTRFLEYCPVIIPPNNQKSHTLQPSPPILPVKTSPPKPLESYGFLSRSHPFSLLDPAVNLFLFQHFHLFGLTVCWAGELMFANNIFARGTSFSLL